MGLDSVERVSVGAVDELFIAKSRVSLVGDDCEVRVTVFAEFTNNLGVVELVGGKELLRVLMSVYFNLGHSVMDSWDLNVFRDSVLEPAF